MNKNPGNFKILADKHEKAIPFVICTDCKKVWPSHKLTYDKANNVVVRTNSRSNYVNHKCHGTMREQVRIDAQQKENLSIKARESYCTFLAKALVKRSTISTNAGVLFANEIANYVSSSTMVTKKNFLYDVSRQNCSKTIIDIGNSKLKQNIEFFMTNYESSSLILDHWTSHGRCFLGIIARTCVLQNNKREIIENLIDFKEANLDKTANGIVQDFKHLVVDQKLILPIITDNCRVMCNLGKFNSNIVKIFCIEHKLVRIEDKLHQLPFFKEHDKQLTLINAYFAFRHGKFDLPRKPLSSISATRPWRSNLLNYQIAIENYEAYQILAEKERNFPDIPSLRTLNKLLEFEQLYCSNFNILEKSDSTIIHGIKVYFQLIQLARNDDFVSLQLEQKIIEELYPLIFSQLNIIFFYLSRADLHGNSLSKIQ